MRLRNWIILTFIFTSSLSLWGQSLQNDSNTLDSAKVFMIRQFMLSDENLERLSDEINVHQNPSGNQLFVVFDDNPEDKIYDIVITDIFNSIIIIREIAHQAEIIDISDLEKGTYIVRVICNNDLLKKEIVIRE